MTNDISKESAAKIAVDFMKSRKNTDKIDVAAIEQNSQNWVVRGTCPIDMEGHPWAERFEVIVDSKGKIVSTYSSLL